MNLDYDFGVLQTLVLTYGMRLVSAILIFLVGKWLANKIAAVTVKIMERNRVDITLRKFLRNILYYFFLVAVIIAAAGQLGINTTSFLTIVGAASLAVGLALKDSLANFSSGVMLILFRPFVVGDVVTVAGETGLVEEITIFHTIMNTGDNQRKIIPNGAISNATITNITANHTRRIDLIVGISYDDDIRQAKETLEEILAQENRVLGEPKPVVAVSELGSSSVDLVVRPWVNTADYWSVRFALVEKIKLTFDERNITFPYPQTDVHLYKAD